MFKPLHPRHEISWKFQPYIKINRYLFIIQHAISQVISQVIQFYNIKVHIKTKKSRDSGRDELFWEHTLTNKNRLILLLTFFLTKRNIREFRQIAEIYKSMFGDWRQH